ncbi:MAG: hypothetical protein Tsb009_11670 [Planctomycetaceae bacterium]
MSRFSLNVRTLCIVAISLSTGLIAHSAQTPSNRKPPRKAKSSRQVKAKSQKQKRQRPPRQVFSGKVVLLKDALKRRGITAFDEINNQVVLETNSGELIPIVPDWRGRAFFQDKRLRNRKVDLVGYRHKGVPYLQVLMVFTYNKAGVRQYTDYWCDICSIPMYEIKPCDCCQAEIRLRFQPRKLPDYIQSEKKSLKPSPVPARKPISSK